MNLKDEKSKLGAAEAKETELSEAELDSVIAGMDNLKLVSDENLEDILKKKEIKKLDPKQMLELGGPTARL